MLLLHVQQFPVGRGGEEVVRAYTWVKKSPQIHTHLLVLPYSGSNDLNLFEVLGLACHL